MAEEKSQSKLIISVYTHGLLAGVRGIKIVSSKVADYILCIFLNCVLTDAMAFECRLLAGFERSKTAGEFIDILYKKLSMGQINKVFRCYVSRWGH